MFFVSLLLNQTLGWMRSQSVTTSLRALLYMDEIYGYLPPTANPPSKKPLMTMLKQARAFGLGVLNKYSVIFLDAYGGYEAPMVLEEKRECDGFTYIWEQASFNPIDGMMDCHIHFTFPDGSRMDRAFSYRWRLWTLPELREMLAEAGFRDIVVYWEGTDEDANEGNGIFEPAEMGDPDPGWICYIVAQP